MSEFTIREADLPAGRFGLRPGATRPPWLNRRFRHRRSPFERRWLLRELAVAGVLTLSLVGLGVRAESQGSELQASVNAKVTVTGEALRGAKQAFEQGDYQAAASQFAIARSSLREANRSLAGRGQLAGLTATAASGNLTASAQLLSAAELLTDSGAELANDLAMIQIDLKAKDNDLLRSGEVLAARLPAIQQHLADTEQRLRLLGYTVADVRRDRFAGDTRQAADQLAAALPGINESIDRGRRVTDALPGLLGIDHFRHYVLWFQNPAELRPTGGFIGTYGKLTLAGGAVRELTVDSIYTVANQANPRITETGPAPYARFQGDNLPAPVWALQNANWSPDFPTSAATFQKFYERGGGPTTDGVIAINIIPIVEILGVVGPIELPQHGYTLSADNFQDTIEADQHVKSTAGDTDPKKILRDFLPQLLGRIGRAPRQQQQAITRIIADAGRDRDLMVYFSNDRLAELASELGVAGQLQPAPHSLAVIDTNIAGRKSSRQVAVTLRREVTVTADGTVDTTLSFERRYAGNSAEINLNYSRFFLPDGSQGIGSDGFSPYAPVAVDQQDGFTVVGGWTDVGPGDTRTTKVRYRAPRRLELSQGRLPLSFQKQSGTAVRVITTVTLPEGYQWSEAAARAGSVDGRTLRFDEPANRDLVYDVLFEDR